MPHRVVAALLGFLLLAAGAFGLGLLVLTWRDDLLALVLFALGVVSLRAVSRLARASDRGAP